MNFTHNGEFAIDNKLGRKYTLDQNYFEKIDSQEKAYFLGFMYADGNVHSKQNRCQITLQKRDREILQKFKILLNYNGKLKNFDEGKSLTLRVHSKKMKQDLINKGCIPQKTFKIEFPNWLREDLRPHFIRGVFDGDGCVSFRVKRKGCKYLQVTISGRKSFLETILNISQFRGRVSKVNGHTSHSLCYSSVASIHFLNWLYKGATIFLERKRNKFLEYLNYKKYEAPYNSRGKKLAEEVLKNEKNNLNFIGRSVSYG